MAIQVLPAAAGATVDLQDLLGRLASHGDFQRTDHLLRGRLHAASNGTPVELTVFRDGRAIIKGTADPAAARSIYARYVGA
jgi:adenylyltransferase/sulfurtransferase